MARIKINLPKSFPFSTDIKVRITDLNYGGHVGNDSILSIIHEARIQYLISIGFEHEGKGPGGIGIIMTDAAIIYSGEIFYGESLNIKIAAIDIETYSFDLVYKITNLATDKIVVKAKTNILCFDYGTRKRIEIPFELMKFINPSI
ncbi:acyl-CoA thioesterase [Bacteroidota bacterium]